MLRKIKLDEIKQEKTANVILKIPVTDTIPYFDDLPGKGAALQHLSSKAFSEKFGAQYEEGLWAEPKVAANMRCNKKTLDDDGVISGIRRDTLESGVRSILQGTAKIYLAITKMGASVGHGVFSTERIPKHTVLCIYSGEIKPGTCSSTSYDLLFYTGNFHIEADKRRGIASFMQHLPGNTEVFGSDKDKYARTNVMPEFIIMDNKPIVVLVALEDIPALTQIGFSYNEYWNTRGIHPHLFYHSGEIAPRTCYKLYQLAGSYEYIPITAQPVQQPSQPSPAAKTVEQAIQSSTLKIAQTFYPFHLQNSKEGLRKQPLDYVVNSLGQALAPSANAVKEFLIPDLSKHSSLDLYFLDKELETYKKSSLSHANEIAHLEINSDQDVSYSFKPRKI